MLLRYPLISSSRMTGISFWTCCAASWPSFTSSAGLYLFLGAVILVCADAIATDSASVAAITVDFVALPDLTGLLQPGLKRPAGSPSAEIVPTGWHPGRLALSVAGTEGANHLLLFSLEGEVPNAVKSDA